MERKQKEKKILSEIGLLKLDLESLKENHEEYRNNIKVDCQLSIELQTIIEEKQKLVDIAREKCDDETQIKNVLMMRIKDLEALQDQKMNNQYDYETEIITVQQKISDHSGIIQITEDQISSLGTRCNFLETNKKEQVDQILKKENMYKEQILNAQKEKQELRQTAEDYKNRVENMNKLLGVRDTQMNQIDLKIDQLIRLKQELTQTRNNELDKLFE